MTLEQVNAIYQKIDNIEERIPGIQWINPTMIIIGVTLIVFFIAIFMIYTKKIDTNNKKITLDKKEIQPTFWQITKAYFIGGIVAYIGLYFIVILLIYGHTKYEMYDLQTEQFKHWKTEYAIPYIESLPVEKHRILYIKIDPEIKTSWDSTFFLGSITSEELTALTISYQDGKKLVTETNWYDSGMELSEANDPYIEYHHLKEQLGNGSDFPAGHYNAKVYMPKGYRFDTIK